MGSTSTRSGPIYLLRPFRHIFRGPRQLDKVHQSMALKKGLHKRVPFFKAMYLSSLLSFRNMYLLRAALQRYSSCTREVDSRFLAWTLSWDPWWNKRYLFIKGLEGTRRIPSLHCRTHEQACTVRRSRSGRGVQSCRALCFNSSACTNIVRRKIQADKD